jgi:hypothetical protein
MTLFFQWLEGIGTVDPGLRTRKKNRHSFPMISVARNAENFLIEAQ